MKTFTSHRWDVTSNMPNVMWVVFKYPLQKSIHSPKTKMPSFMK
jgi:hypothetical protein